MSDDVLENEAVKHLINELVQYKSLALRQNEQLIANRQLYNRDMKAMSRNVSILTEVIYEMGDALAELRKITATYHPMIIRGEASGEDIQECSNICQRAMKSLKRAYDLQKTYDKIRADVNALTEDFNIIKED